MGVAGERVEGGGGGWGCGSGEARGEGRGARGEVRERGGEAVGRGGGTHDEPSSKVCLIVMALSLVAPAAFFWTAVTRTLSSSSSRT